jgi:DNA-binding NarL/FixJ family response regulator
MEKPKVCERSRKLQLLLVGGSEEDQASLCHLMTGDDNDQFHLGRTTSPEDALAQLEKKMYDLLLCSYKLCDDDVLRLLRQVRENDARVSVSFLSDHADRATIEALIRARHFDRATSKVSGKRRLQAEPQRSQKGGRHREIGGLYSPRFQ